MNKHGIQETGQAENCEFTKLGSENPFNLFGKQTRTAKKVKMSFFELEEDSSAHDKENRENPNNRESGDTIPSILKQRQLSKIDIPGKGSQRPGKRSQRNSRKRSLVCLMNPRKSSTISTNSPLRNKKFRNVRRCVFERPNLKNLRVGRQNIITSKKNTLKLLEENLKSSVGEYNTVYNNILVENLIRNYPNYLKDFRRRVDEDQPR